MSEKALKIAEQIISGYIRVGAIDMINVDLERVMMEIKSALAATTPDTSVDDERYEEIMKLCRTADKPLPRIDELSEYTMNMGDHTKMTRKINELISLINQHSDMLEKLQPNPDAWRDM